MVSPHDQHYSAAALGLGSSRVVPRRAYDGATTAAAAAAAAAVATEQQRLVELGHGQKIIQRKKKKVLRLLLKGIIFLLVISSCYIILLNIVHVHEYHANYHDTIMEVNDAGREGELKGELEVDERNRNIDRRPTRSIINNDNGNYKINSHDNKSNTGNTHASLILEESLQVAPAAPLSSSPSSPSSSSSSRRHPLTMLLETMYHRIKARQDSCHEEEQDEREKDSAVKEQFQFPILKDFYSSLHFMNAEHGEDNAPSTVHHGNETSKNVPLEARRNSYCNEYCKHCSLPSSQIQFIDEGQNDDLNVNSNTIPCPSSSSSSTSNKHSRTMKLNYTDDGYAVILSFTPKLIVTDIKQHQTDDEIGAEESINNQSPSPSFRSLFINLLYIRTFQDVNSIIILYYGHDIQHLMNDELYGKRIWNWHLHTMERYKDKDTEITATKEAEQQQQQQQQQHYSSSAQPNKNIRIITQHDIDAFENKKATTNIYKNYNTNTNTTNNNKSHTSHTHHDLFHHVLFPFHPLLLQHFEQQTVLYLHQNDNDRYHLSDKLIFRQNAYFGGEQTFRAGYELSKMNHDTLVGFRVDSFDTSAYSVTEKNGDVLTKRGNDDYHRHDNGDEVDESESWFTAHCHPPIAPSLLSSAAAQQGYNQAFSQHSSSITRIINISGTFISRKYFCLIWNPMFDNYRSFVQNKSISSTSTRKNNNNNNNNNVNEEVQALEDDGLVGIQERKIFIQSIALSTIVSQLSNKSPLIYPMVKQTIMDSQEYNNDDEKINLPDLDSTKARNNHIVQPTSRRKLSVEIETDMTFARQYSPHSPPSDDIRNHHRRRRKDWDLDNHDINFYKKKDSPRQQSSSILQQRRLLHEDNYANNQLIYRHNGMDDNEDKVLFLKESDYTFLNDNIAYFGSSVSTLQCWCGKTTRVFIQGIKKSVDEIMKRDVDCQSVCNEKYEDLTISNLVWMTKKSIMCAT